MRDAVRPLLRRLAAYAIDVAILAAILIPIAFGTQALLGYRADTGIGVWLASLGTISVPSWAYFTICDASPSGATIGKRVLGLRVARSDGSRLRIGSAQLGTFSGFQFALLWVVYGLFAVYLVVALRNGGGRSVQDLVAGSAVMPAPA